MMALDHAWPRKLCRLCGVMMLTTRLSCCWPAWPCCVRSGMVESAFEFANICRKHDYHNFVFSMKASNPLVMVQVGSRP